jgi:hypothetical protein
MSASLSKTGHQGVRRAASGLVKSTFEAVTGDFVQSVRDGVFAFRHH